MFLLSTNMSCLPRSALSFGVILLVSVRGDAGKVPLSERPLADRGLRETMSSFLWLPWLTVARFRNDPCISEDGETTGICYTEQECEERSGIPSGECAEGYGKCCIFHRTCEDVSALNNSYFVNPNYPATNRHSMACKMIIQPSTNNICQLRLDFEEFELAAPDLYARSAGQCNTDRLLITGVRGESPPQLCGVNRGQHMYVDASGDITPTIMEIITFGDKIDRKWKIKVTQIPCNSKATVPTGCVQYYTGLQGSVKSFNFDGNNVHLADHRYSICVGIEPSFCSIEWSAVRKDEAYHSFSISDTFPPRTAGVAGTEIPDPRTRVSNSSDFILSTCSGVQGYSDFVSIPCATPEGGRAFTILGENGGDVISCAHKFCGQALNGLNGAIGHEAVSSSVKPFMISVHFDSNESEDGGDGGLPNRGFHLEWMQKPCQAQTWRENVHQDPDEMFDVFPFTRKHPVPPEGLPPLLPQSFATWLRTRLRPKDSRF